MTLTRRTALLGAAAFCAVPSFTAAATSSRRFDFYRGDKRIGQQTITVSRSGDAVDVSVNIGIKVRLLGLPVYNYSLASRERWVAGKLQSLNSQTNDNGTQASVQATAAGGGLSVRGSGYSGALSGHVATTTYWTPSFLERRTWVSTQDGQPLSVGPRQVGRVRVPGPGGTVSATRWAVGGDLNTLNLFYDDAGEWVGGEFQARGETARMVMTDRGAALRPLWTG